MRLFAVNFIPLPGSLYMFRAFYAPIIRSTILAVSTASGTNLSIVSATFFQRGLILTGVTVTLVPEAVDTVKIVLMMMGV